jgi:hypothetical protein
MTIRPLTMEDLAQWWPDVVVPHTVRGFVAQLGDRIMGVAFLMYQPNVVAAYAEMVPEGQQYPLSIMRMVKKMKALMATVNAPIFTLADEAYPNSRAFLEHVGFEHVNGRQYVFRKAGG